MFVSPIDAVRRIQVIAIRSKYQKRRSLTLEMFCLNTVTLYNLEELITMLYKQILSAGKIITFCTPTRFWPTDPTRLKITANRKPTVEE